MAVDREFIDELTARCDIVDVVSRYVQLKKSGSNYFGLCPFHNEKHGSFSVSADKQIYHCFGCGAGGSVIGFIMRIEGLEFLDAVQFLSRQVGMQVPERQMDAQTVNRRERMLALYKDTARFFYEQLWAPEHAEQQRYFAQRGLQRKTMNRFGLGYAPDSFNALMDAMRAKGYTKEEMLDAGLLSKNERGNVYDRFRHRVMFPIIDVRGQVIAFGGRVMDDSKPKYLNSPETMLFHKSRNLFALNLAKKTKSDYFILAEGYMDVIALHQAGFDSAVASLGTSLTEEQVRMIARYTKNIVISYDADGAGKAAAERAIDLLKTAELSVRVLRIPGAKDPDEYIREKGPDAYRRLIEGSENHIAYRLDTVAAKYDLQEDGARIQFLQDAAQELARIDNAVEREVYIGRAAKMANISMEAMQVEVKRRLQARLRKEKTQVRREIRAPVAAAQPKDRTLQYQNIKSARAEEGILAMLFTDQSLMPYVRQRIQPEQFTAPTLAAIYQHALALEDAGNLISVAAFEGVLAESEMNLLCSIVSESVSTQQRTKALEDYINTILLQQARQEPTQGMEDPLTVFARKQKEKKGYGGNKE